MQDTVWPMFYNDEPPSRRATLPVVTTSDSGDAHKSLEICEALPLHARIRKVPCCTVAVVVHKSLILQALGARRNMFSEDSDADLVQYYRQFKQEHARELDEASRHRREMQRRQSKGTNTPHCLYADFPYL